MKDGTIDKIFGYGIILLLVADAYFSYNIGISSTAHVVLLAVILIVSGDILGKLDDIENHNNTGD